MKSFTPQFQLGSIFAAVSLFGAAVYLTRAKSGRVAGALMGSLMFTACNVLWDIAAHEAGWWWYPSLAGPILPLPVYFAQDLVWGGAVGLASWRIQRRFGPRGMAAFLPVLIAIGALRDFAWASVTKAISFGSGVGPLLADCACWASLFIIAQVTMRLISGSATHDKLARIESR